MTKRSGARKAWRVARGQVDPRCDYCLIETFEDVPETHPQRATVEDIVPRSKGGANNETNWALACRLCNHVKGDGEALPINKVPLRAIWKRMHRARIVIERREQKDARQAEVERLARLARLPFTLYPPIPGVPDEAFR